MRLRYLSTRYILPRIRRLRCTGILQVQEVFILVIVEKLVQRTAWNNVVVRSAYRPWMILLLFMFKTFIVPTFQPFSEFFHGRSRSRAIYFGTWIPSPLSADVCADIIAEFILCWAGNETEAYFSFQVDVRWGTAMTLQMFTDLYFSESTAAQ